MWPDRRQLRAVRTAAMMTTLGPWKEVVRGQYSNRIVRNHVATYRVGVFIRVHRVLQRI
jgi:hypothetical protein